MTDAIEWYRSSSATLPARSSWRRAARNWLRAQLPEPDVRGKTMVVYSRRTWPRPTRGGFQSDFHGLFSEFHSVLGALSYGERHGAAGVRVRYSSPLYDDAARGPNWWTYYFESADMPLQADVFPAAPEVHLNRVLTKYGRYGGFSDIVGGPLAYLYPITFGLSRHSLRRLLDAHVRVRREILDEVRHWSAARFEPGAFVVGVHYRGTDSTHKWTGRLNNYRTSRVPYEAYAAEIRRVLEAASPRHYQVFVATDEIDCLEFMRRTFAGRLIALDDAPRVRPHQQAVHLDQSLPVSKYQKGKSALVDCLLLSAASYLVKGRSNLSDASLAFNPALPYSLCPDVAALRPVR
jgi:hypothetical protein